MSWNAAATFGLSVGKAFKATGLPTHTQCTEWTGLEWSWGVLWKHPHLDLEYRCNLSFICSAAPWILQLLEKPWKALLHLAASASPEHSAHSAHSALAWDFWQSAPWAWADWRENQLSWSFHRVTMSIDELRRSPWSQLGLFIVIHFFISPLSHPLSCFKCLPRSSKPPGL